MHFVTTLLDNVMLVEPDPASDERGTFVRLYCSQEFAVAGVRFEPKQTSLSHNDARLTLRGMHYCAEPEIKLVHCVRGRIYDVALDVRRASPTFGQWFGCELSPGSHGLLIPAGVAHGFLTLEPDSDVLYQIDRLYRPGFDAGLRWNDPAFKINWPANSAVIHRRDATYPDFY